MMLPARKFLVKGRVQGVGFRHAARAEAVRLQLCGWVKNLSGGDVEVVARGTSAALSALESWLRHGPPAAEVHAVEEVTDSPVLPGASGEDDEFRIL